MTDYQSQQFISVVRWDESPERQQRALQGEVDDLKRDMRFFFSFFVNSVFFGEAAFVLDRFNTMLNYTSISAFVLPM